MPSRPGVPVADVSAPAEPRLTRLFVLIVLTQAAAVAALYWFGQHFS